MRSELGIRNEMIYRKDGMEGRIEREHLRVKDPEGHGQRQSCNLQRRSRGAGACCAAGIFIVGGFWECGCGKNCAIRTELKQEAKVEFRKSGPIRTVLEGGYHGY